MTGENFKRVNRNTQAKELKSKILKIKEECGKLYTKCKNTGDFDYIKHDKLSKQIEWLDYLLWGYTKGGC